MPCFNEASRLPVQDFIEQTPSNVDLLFANDGSTDQTLKVLEGLQQSRPGTRVFNARTNGGKAQVIQKAFEYAVDNHFLDDYRWIGFWDADLATPLSEINFFLTYHKVFAPQKSALFGSRIKRYGADINRSPLRHYLSRVFVTFTDLLLGIKTYDSQCGAKLFKPQVARIAFQEEFLSRWIFDLEIILRIGKDCIVEIPVQKWHDIKGSKINLLKESRRVFFDLLKIRKKYL